jgi:hypothetical protein
MSSIEANFDRLALLDDEGWTANNHYHSLLLTYVPENCENAIEIPEMRALADEILPGAEVRRHLLWRYSLVYQKPATDSHG